MLHEESTHLRTKWNGMVFGEDCCTWVKAKHVVTTEQTTRINAGLSGHVQLPLISTLQHLVSTWTRKSFFTQTPITQLTDTKHFNELARCRKSVLLLSGAAHHALPRFYKVNIMLRFSPSATVISKHHFIQHRLSRWFSPSLSNYEGWNRVPVTHIPGVLQIDLQNI